MRHLLAGLTVTAMLAASAESRWIEASAPRPWLWLLLAAGPPAALAILLRVRSPLRSIVRRHEASLSVVLHALGYFAILYPAGWARLCLDDLGWRGRPLPSMGLLLAPALALAGSMAGATRAAGVPRRRAIGETARVVAVFAGVFLVAAGAVDLLEVQDETARLLDLHPGLSFAAGALSLALLVMAAPLLTLLAIPTRPIPESPLRDRLRELARRRGLRRLGIRLGRAGDDGSLNACAIGIVPGARLILLSPGLLRILRPDDVAAVFAHEVAHLASRHLGWYLLQVSALLLWIGAFAPALASLSPLLNAAAVLALVGLFLRFVFGPMSRRFELEADASGAEMVGHGAYAATLLRMIALLSPGARRDGWRHYSLKRRLDTVLELAVNPAARARLAGGMRRARWAVAAVLAAAIVVFASAGLLGTASGRVDALLSAADGSLSLAESIRTSLEDRDPASRWRLQRPDGAVRAHLERLLDRAALYLDEARLLIADDDSELLRRIEELHDRALGARVRSDPLEALPRPMEALPRITP